MMELNLICWICVGVFSTLFLSSSMSEKREGGFGWGGQGAGHYSQQGNIELVQTNSHNDP